MSFRRPLDVGDESGFTLAELMVSITLLTIVSAAIISSTVAVQRNLGGANATMRDLGTTTTALDRVGQLLRGGVSPDGQVSEGSAAVTEAAPDAVTFYSTVGRTAQVSGATGDYVVLHPQQVRLFVREPSPGEFELVEQVWDPITNAVDDGPLAFGGTPRERVILRDLQSTAVFTYWSHYEDLVTPQDSDRCGRRIGGALPGPPATTATLTTPTDLARVDSVSFRLQSQEESGYDSIASDLQGFARFAGSTDLGVSSTFDSAGCLDGDRSTFDDVFQP